jgi:hypothetical protein
MPSQNSSFGDDEGILLKSEEKTESWDDVLGVQPTFNHFLLFLIPPRR